MRTIDRRLGGTNTSGEWPAQCDYCGVAWPRKQLRTDGAGKLVCPDEGAGLDQVTLRREEAARARQIAGERLADTYDNAPFHVNYDVPAAEPEVEQLLLQQVSTEGMLLAVCPGERVNGEYTGPLLSVRVGEAQPVDIGYGSDNLYDADALEALCGSSDGFAYRWFDQLGSGYDLLQTIPGRQPKVWDGATVLPVTSGSASMLAPTFDGVDDHMIAGIPETLIRENALTVVLLFKRVGPRESAYLWEFGTTRASFSALEMRQSVLGDDTLLLICNGGITTTGFDIDTWQDLTMVMQEHGFLGDVYQSQNGVSVAAGGGSGDNVALTLDKTGNKFSVAAGVAGSTPYSSLAIGAAFVWARALDADELNVIQNWVRDRL